MAESVDALVSNTSGFTSIPVRPRVWVQKGESSVSFLLFCFIYVESERLKIYPSKKSGNLNCLILNANYWFVILNNSA